MVKALSDFEEYAASFLKVRSKEGEVVPFRFLPAQRSLYKALLSSSVPRIVCLKSRQQGVSTFCSAYIFWKCVTNKNYNALIVAQDRDTSRRLLESVGMMYDELPDSLKPMRKYRSREEILFENPKETLRASNPGLRSRIEIKTAGFLFSGRGTTIHALHFSEVSSYQNPDEIVASLLPTVPGHPNTCIFIESTSSVTRGGLWFKDLWEASKRGETPFVPVFVPWYVTPEYTLSGKSKKLWLRERLTEEEKSMMRNLNLTEGQIAWRRYKIAEFGGDERKFMQEYPTQDSDCFLAAGSPFVPASTIRTLQQGVEPPVKIFSVEKSGEIVPDPSGELYVWEEPVPGASYTVGVDVSSGTGESYSAVQVVKYDHPVYVHVARWYNKVSPIDLADIVISIARYYNEALVSVETNSIGMSTMVLIKEKGYWKQFRWRYLDSFSSRLTDKLGWSTTSGSKPLLMQHFLHLLNTGQLRIRDSNTVEEISRLVDDGRGAAEAGLGAGDDLAISLAIATYTTFLENRGLAYGREEIVESVPTSSGWTLSDLISVRGGSRGVW